MKTLDPLEDHVRRHRRNVGIRQDIQEHRASRRSRVRDVLQALSELVPAEAGLSVADLEEAADRLLRSGLAIPVVGAGEAVASPAIRRRDGRLVWSRLEGRYATVELLSVEREAIKLALSGRGIGVGVASAESLRLATASRPSLSAEQRVMVERLVRNGDRVAAVLGQAGTGKTFALAASREAWGADGIPVAGAAVARRAAG